MYYEGIGINKGSDPTKSNKSKECMIWHYCFFNHEFKRQDSAWNDLTTLCLNISDITIITFKNVNYPCIIHNISKSQAINLIQSAVLENRGYL